MKHLKLFLALAAGLAVLALVLTHFDLGLVRQALGRAGISGLAIVIVAGLAAELVLAIGIIPLLPRPMPVSVVFAARQLRDSSSDVLPITQIGGVAFAARAFVLAGLDAFSASASVIADLTTETFAQGLYVLAGVAASLSLLHRNALLSPWTGAMLAGALFLSIGSLLFAVLQLNGSRWAERIGGKLFASSMGHAHSFSAAVHGIYRRRGQVAASILLQFAGWIASGLWLWVVLKVMDIDAGLWSASLHPGPGRRLAQRHRLYPRGHRRAGSRLCRGGAGVRPAARDRSCRLAAAPRPRHSCRRAGAADLAVAGNPPGGARGVMGASATPPTYYRPEQCPLRATSGPSRRPF